MVEIDVAGSNEVGGKAKGGGGCNCFAKKPTADVVDADVEVGGNVEVEAEIEVEVDANAEIGGNVEADANANVEVEIEVPRVDIEVDSPNVDLGADIEVEADAQANCDVVVDVEAPIVEVEAGGQVEVQADNGNQNCCTKFWGCLGQTVSWILVTGMWFGAFALLGFGIVALLCVYGVANITLFG